MRTPLVLAGLLALAGCAGLDASVPQASAVRFLVLAEPAAALDSVAAYAAGSDLLAADRTGAGLALRDRRAGQDNRALVTARPVSEQVTEVSVASTFRVVLGSRDLGVMVYAGAFGERGATFARPVEGSPSCFDLDGWFEAQLEAPAARTDPPPPDDAEPPEEVAPELIGGLPGLMGRVTYPATLRRAGMQGTVLVEFIVDQEGRVSCAQAAASPHPQFTAAALAAVEASVFTPGTQGGIPVSIRFTVPVDFRLR